jgi:hypothetical protein
MLAVRFSFIAMDAQPSKQASIEKERERERERESERKRETAVVATKNQK